MEYFIVLLMAIILIVFLVRQIRIRKIDKLREQVYGKLDELRKLQDHFIVGDEILTIEKSILTLEEQGVKGFGYDYVLGNYQVKLVHLLKILENPVEYFRLVH